MHILIGILMALFFALAIIAAILDSLGMHGEERFGVALAILFIGVPITVICFWGLSLLHEIVSDAEQKRRGGLSRFPTPMN